ncbi:hypothetical protein CPC08DRAFT_729356 [Agrocybe pediades]|nr:hypothetical protein CPC08DRAFT_729356 [Agrocybe pediades]
MTSNANGFIPISQQEAIIGADLNSTLLYQFLFGMPFTIILKPQILVLTVYLLGIYTRVFPVTLYIYYHKENCTPSRDRIIIGTIAALYSVTFLNMMLDWYYTNVVFITQGTRWFTKLRESLTFFYKSNFKLLDVNVLQDK